jgi:4-hydroxybenzoate polyprenyltransferase
MRAPVLPRSAQVLDPAASSRSSARALLVSARPRQWTKNLFVLLPVVFAGRTSAPDLGRAGAAFVAFCLASSGLYLVNDVLDRELDRRHERKRARPIASGELGVRTAVTAAVALLLAAAAAAVPAGLRSGGLLALYVASILAYSFGVKHVALLDVLVIAAGFVIRVAAGSFALGATPSEWLLLCTMFLALFLGFGKRRHELLLLGDGADEHRPVLSVYTREIVDELLTASMIGALLSYAMYTFFSQAAVEHNGLMLTIPFAVYGIFRYMLLVHTSREGGSPEELLLTDRPLQAAVALWGLVAMAVVLV